MIEDRIDFISSYCDRWCERCGFTTQCSTYACETAIAMCGNVTDGLELALRTPQPAYGGAPALPSWRDDLSDISPTPEELIAFEAAEAERDERIDAVPLATAAAVHSMSSFEWLVERSESLLASAGAVLAEALNVVAHDSALIGVKVERALHGRDRAEHDEEELDDDPVQNDWNGSAKVALILAERSETAWQTIALATRDPVAGVLADQLADIRRLLTDTFPQAMGFIRPGFDQP